MPVVPRAVQFTSSPSNYPTNQLTAKRLSFPPR